jgi:hypothetical protein
MPTQVFDALKVILDEFGDCDLGPRLSRFAKGDDSKHISLAKSDAIWGD